MCVLIQAFQLYNAYTLYKLYHSTDIDCDLWQVYVHMLWVQIMAEVHNFLQKLTALIGLRYMKYIGTWFVDQCCFFPGTTSFAAVSDSSSHE